MVTASPRILLVEDDDDLRELCAQFLTCQGFQVYAASDAICGFTCACRERPDLIVTDMQMPVADGWELIRRVKADTRTKAIPVLIMSGLPSDAVPYKHLNCIGFLRKPCSPEVLAHFIRTALRLGTP